MHISQPIILPESRPAQRPSERGFAAAVVLFALIALGGSLWLSPNGAAPCGEEGLTVACRTP